MHNVFILKTNQDSEDFKKDIYAFIKKYTKKTETIAAIYELNETEKSQAEAIINQ